MIYLPQHLASFLEDDLKAVQALVFVLHRNLLTVREDKKEEENLLTPILSALTGLVKESAAIRRFVKLAVFNEEAVTPSTATATAAPNKSATQPFSVQRYALTGWRGAAC